MFRPDLIFLFSTLRESGIISTPGAQLLSDEELLEGLGDNPLLFLYFLQQRPLTA